VLPAGIAKLQNLEKLKLSNNLLSSTTGFPAEMVSIDDYMRSD
jgi:Leucine-rich repeat (LRR) protein